MPWLREAQILRSRLVKGLLSYAFECIPFAPCGCLRMGGANSLNSLDCTPTVPTDSDHNPGCYPTAVLLCSSSPATRRSGTCQALI